MKENTGRQIKADPTLVSINIPAALMEYSIRLNKLSYCLIAESTSGLSEDAVLNSEDEAYNQIFNKMVRENEAICNVLKAAENETREYFNEVKRTNKLMEKQYVFSLYSLKSDSEDAGFGEENIGLFSTLGSCEKVELMAREYNLPTIKCGEWINYLGD